MRCFLVIVFARFLPPLRPNATAAGSLFASGFGVLAAWPVPECFIEMLEKQYPQVIAANHGCPTGCLTISTLARVEQNRHNSSRIFWSDYRVSRPYRPVCRPDGYDVQTRLYDMQPLFDVQSPARWHDSPWQSLDPGSFWRVGDRVGRLPAPYPSAS